MYRLCSNYKIVAMCSFIILVSLLMHSISSVKGNDKALVFAEPDSLKFESAGGNFSLTIKLSNAIGVVSWQIAMEYNDTVANLTGWDLPVGHIFEGKSFLNISSIESTISGNKYILLGAQLLIGKVDVPDVGILCRLNFTVLGDGNSPLRLGTEENPILTSSSRFDPGSGKWTPSFYCKVASSGIDPQTGLPTLIEIPIEVKGSVVTVGEVKVAPTAYFTAQTVPFNKEGLLLLGDTSFFVDKPILFNASASSDIDGEIVAYEWDFGDGNITIVDEPIVYHIYSISSRAITITLRVWDNDGLVSEPFQKTITVGIALTPLNLMFYLQILVFLIVIVVAVSVVRSIYKYFRVKRKF